VPSVPLAESVLKANAALTEARSLIPSEEQLKGKKGEEDTAAAAFAALDSSAVVDKYSDAAAEFDSLLRSSRKALIELQEGEDWGPSLQRLEGFAKRGAALAGGERSLLLLLQALIRGETFFLQGSVGAESQKVKTKPEDAVRFADLFLQYLSLEGLKEEDEGAQKDAAEEDAVKRYSEAGRAAKCLALACALAPSSAPDEQLKEAFVLAEHAVSLMNSKETEPPKSAPSGFEEVHSLVVFLLGRFRDWSARWASRLAARVCARAAGVEDPVLRAASKELSLNLSASSAADAIEGPGLVPFPPTLQFIPCKPLLFDLASSALRPPDISHRVKAEKKGILGRIGAGFGLWGKK